MLAGRRLAAEEAEAVGQRLSEPTPVVELMKKQEGLIILGDPGAGKTTFLKYVALMLATGRHGEAGTGAQAAPARAPLRLRQCPG